MRIILLQNVENLGKKGEVKKVADGYARNFLIPNQMAVLATKTELQKLKEQKEIEAQQAEEELLNFQEIASQMDGLELEIPAKVSEDGKLFGGIGPSKIAEKLKELGFEIEKGQVKLENPIKEIGEYEAIIELPHNLEAKVKVIVVEEK